MGATANLTRTEAISGLVAGGAAMGIASFSKSNKSTLITPESRSNKTLYDNQVYSFAHDFTEGSTFKTSVFSQPEWLLESNTELLDPVMSGNGTSRATDSKTSALDPDHNRSDLETEGFSAGAIKFPDCTKLQSLGKADGFTEEASRAAA